MERMGLISHTNLHFLKTIIQEICPMLMEKITQFEANYSKLQEICTACVTVNIYNVIIIISFIHIALLLNKRLHSTSQDLLI